MRAHLSFWIGFFAAALLAVPIAGGIMRSADEQILQVAIVIFVGVATLVVFLVFVLLFRDWILRRLLGRTEVALEDVAGSLVQSVAAASAGDRDAAATHAETFVKAGIGWYTWSNFYRWVFATALGLLLAFGAFWGTVLLFEQTRTLRVQTERIADQTALMASQTELMEAQTARLQEQTEAAALQNEISGLNLVNQLRDQMLATIESQTLGDWLRSFGMQGIEEPLLRFTSRRRNCDLGFDLDHVLHSAPSQASLGAIEALTWSPSIGDRVGNALELLVQDRNGGVALGALMLLDKIDMLAINEDIQLRNVIVSEFVRLRSPEYELSFSGSYVANLHCPDCNVHITGSVFFQKTRHWYSGHSNVFLGGYLSSPLNGLTVTYGRDEPPDDWTGVPLERGPFFLEENRAWLTQHEAGQVCDEFVKLARINPMLKVLSSTGRTSGGE
ncbi:MAG: hypothetical protein AAGL96_10130 [Pseudomonadota bacterium]